MISAGGMRRGVVRRRGCLSLTVMNQQTHGPRQWRRNMRPTGDKETLGT